MFYVCRVFGQLLQRLLTTPWLIHMVISMVDITMELTWSTQFWH